MTSFQLTAVNFLSYQFRTVIPSLGVFSEWHFYYNKSIGMQREYSGSFRLRMLVLRDGHSGSMSRCGIRMAALVFSWRVLSCKRMLTLSLASFASLNVFVYCSTRFGCFMCLCWISLYQLYVCDATYRMRDTSPVEQAVRNHLHSKLKGRPWTIHPVAWTPEIGELLCGLRAALPHGLIYVLRCRHRR